MRDQNRPRAQVTHNKVCLSYLRWPQWLSWGILPNNDSALTFMAIYQSELYMPVTQVFTTFTYRLSAKSIRDLPWLAGVALVGVTLVGVIIVGNSCPRLNSYYC